MKVTKHLKEKIRLKKKRFYKTGEVIFLHEKKTTGKVVRVIPKDLSVEVLYKKLTENGGVESVTETFLLENVDKYRPAKFNVNIKYMEGQDKKLAIEKNGDWIDVYTNAEVFIHQFEQELIPLGFALEIPKGYEAFLAPRSSTFKNYGVIVANSFGIIDNTYCGDTDEWKLSVVALRETAIPKGAKIAKFRLIKSMTDHDGAKSIKFNEVDTLDNESRGGFGTTGV